jgi:5-methylcytosine-specific restriction endonuclease McrA
MKSFLKLILVKKVSRLQHKKGRKSNYALSLKTDNWKEVRQKILVRDRCCVDCGSKLYLEVHHLTYKNKGNELENLQDLILLCSKCHQKRHSKN